MSEEWITVSHKLLLSWRENAWTVVKDRVHVDNHHKLDYTYIQHPGSVIIVPALSGDRILMVEQYRYPIRRWSLEFPAGGIEKGEDPLAAAHRELREELQYEAGEMSHIGSFHTSNSITDECMHIFGAANLIYSQSRGSSDEPPGMKNYQFPFDQIWQKICAGNISDGPTIIAALLWKEHTVKCAKR